MSFKNIVWIIILILLVFALGFWIFDDKEIGEETSGINSTTDSMDGKHCFINSHAATDMEPYTTEEHMVLNISGTTVTGIKMGTQMGPDMNNGYEGTLSGKLENNMMELTYSYTIEGSAQKEVEVYELKGDSLVQLQYVLKDVAGVLMPDKSSDPNKITYTKEECK